MLLEPSHQTLDHIAPSVGGPAEAGRTPAPPAPLARGDALFGDHTADAATAQVSSEAARIVTPIRHHQLRAGARSAASRAGPYPHACQQFLADGALVLLPRSEERCQGVAQTVANQ
ncbi:MAG TPA: hypothetical protein VFH16_00090, partial [Rubrobacter sp.]|nr:hypothetical protein [Rubrobacter sp.]